MSTKNSVQLAFVYPPGRLVELDSEVSMTCQTGGADGHLWCQRHYRGRMPEHFDPDNWRVQLIPCACKCHVSNQEVTQDGN